MRSRRLARRYALALGDLSHEQGMLEQVEQELKSFVQAATDVPALRRAIESESVGTDEKMAIVREAFGDTFSRLTLNFLLLVVSKRRESSLFDMIEEFFDYADEKRGVIEVELKTARALSDENSKLIAEKLAEVLGKQVRLVAFEDESLLGGVVARVGGLVMDGSVKARLRNLGEQLRRAQLN